MNVVTIHPFVWVRLEKAWLNHAAGLYQKYRRPTAGVSL